MIVINDSGKPLAWMRTPKAMKAVQDSDFSSFDGMKVDSERKRFYIIVAHPCNARCWFCLCHKLDPHVCKDSVLTSRVTEIIETFDECISVSITGGEPFLFPARLRAILKGLDAARIKQKPRWVGIATNAARPPAMEVFKEYLEQTNFHFFISRHYIDDASMERLFHIPQLPLGPLIDELRGIGANIMLSCNLMTDGISDCNKIKEYCDFAKNLGVNRVTFRELNHVSGDSSRWGESVHDYICVSDQMRVPISQILDAISNDNDFTFITQDVRPYIYHEYWEYHGVTACFRLVDEAALRAYEGRPDKEQTELVLYPDGSVSTWDK